jgi:thymidylate synthase
MRSKLPGSGPAKAVSRFATIYVVVIEADTIGAAWLAVARQILDEGAASTYDASPILELERMTITVARPASADPIVAELGDPARLEWMHANFTDHALVTELGDARSYASRLYDYAASGRDQVQWVIDRLRSDPRSRSATITTFEPLLDTSYIPCVSLLDFWIRDGRLDSVVYAHSIDFGAKGYGNLVELAYLMERVADGLELPIGRLDFLVKSAHIYEPDFAAMRAATAIEAALSN